MSQQSKLRQSRQQWKQKAKERADQNRYLRKELERLRHERDRAKQALKEANKPLRQKEARPTHLKTHRVWLTLTLFARAHLSFRAVSRVLHVLADWLGIGQAPCPQTVINWVMRLSIVRMQAVQLLQGAGSPVIDDISHAVANMLKRRYEKHPQFATFLAACGRVSGRLKHTVLACLTPPTVHTTSRFMNVHRLVRWADRVLGLLPAGRAKAGSVLAQLRTCLDDLPACRTLIRQFRDDAVALF